MLTDFNRVVIDLVNTLKKKSLRLVTAESCTGGLLAERLTSLAGSSNWFDRGFITYSNASKREILNVSDEILCEFGAVSRESVIAMVVGALKCSNAQFSIAISGIAGPGGGSVDKPVGTVWFAWKLSDLKLETSCQHFVGNREEIRVLAVEFALKYGHEFLM